LNNRFCRFFRELILSTVWILARLNLFNFLKMFELLLFMILRFAHKICLVIKYFQRKLILSFNSFHHELCLLIILRQILNIFFIKMIVSFLKRKLSLIFPIKRFIINELINLPVALCWYTIPIFELFRIQLLCDLFSIWNQIFIILNSCKISYLIRILLRLFGNVWERYTEFVVFKFHLLSAVLKIVFGFWILFLVIVKILKSALEFVYNVNILVVIFLYWYAMLY